MKNTIKKILSAVLSFSVLITVSSLSGCEKNNETVSDKNQIVEDSNVILVNNGVSDYSILLRKDYDKAEEYAAEEFNRLLKEASGAELPIVTETSVKSSKYVSIGETAISKAAGISPTRETYTRNGFHIKSVGEDLIINAPERSGLIYGVYRFFEENSGYMYYDVDTFKIDNNPTVKIKKFDYQDWPDFLNRDVFCYGTSNNPMHAMRLYNTGGQFSKWDEKYGEGSWWSQSLDDQSLLTKLLKVSVYGTEHPDWYYVEGYKRQLCYTTALYSKDEFEKGDFSEENYADGRHGMFWTLVYNLIHNHIMVEEDKMVFLLGMNDNDASCKCDECVRDNEKYEKSGVCIRFINAVAREVENWRLENCPERTIFLSVFAYQGLTIPPVKKVNGEYVAIDDSVVVEDNVLIRYAPSTDYYLFPLLDEEHNPGATEALRGWSLLAKNLSVWDYRAGFWDLIYPFPNWLSEYENIKTYKEMGFVDVLNQSSSYFDGLPFLPMDNWVRSRLLWDTTLDYDKLIAEFCEVYYGDAGEYIREYMDYLTAHYLTYMLDRGRMANPHYAYQISVDYFPIEVVNNIENIFEKAYAAIEPVRMTDEAEYERLKIHVDQESLFYKYCQIDLYRNYYVSADVLDMITEFERIQKKIGFVGLQAKRDDFATIIANWRKEITEKN